MSHLLNSLLEVIGHPDREDLLQVAVPSVYARIRELTTSQQLEMRDEITAIRRTLAPASPA
jgi:hypothetical protein